jgi:activating signal cointegrator 1
MKAISLIQPYATLILLGYKQLETRSWQTSHRGNLAIHASAGKPDWARAVCETDPYIRRALEKHGLTFDTLPRGAVLGTVGVRGMHVIDKPLVVRISPLEFACGDYSMPGRYAWELFAPVPLAEPIPCRGALSVWEVPTEVVQQIYPHANLG